MTRGDAATPDAKKHVGSSPEAIKRHYDLSDEFFQLWLDPLMVYSCAMFDGTNDLAEAQLRKLDHHIAAANAAGASHVLDIGCGWGALLNRLVGQAGAKRATGLTLSTSQAKWARARSLPGVEILEQNWRDHQPARPYDGIISIGAFEHFVHAGIEPAAKLAAYREFFAWCEKALVSQGRLSLQTIAWTVPPTSDTRQRVAFIQESIFPESELPLVWEPIAASEGRFELLALRNDGDHYYRTLRQWERNLATKRSEAIALVGEENVETVRQYLRTSAAAFKCRLICLLRMTFQRVS